MKDVNRITVCREDYSSQYEFENGIKDVVMMLLKNQYIMTVKYDESSLDIVCIDFNYADESMGNDYPCWLSPKEQESVVWDNV